MDLITRSEEIRTETEEGANTAERVGSLFKNMNERLQPVIGSVTDLKSVEGEYDGQGIHLAGYNEPGDGGGGTFFWDSSSTETDNGGTILEVDGITEGRWKRPASSVIPVKWFGAVEHDPTDPIDVTSNVQAAVDWAEANGGLVVLFDTQFFRDPSSASIEVGNGDSPATIASTGYKSGLIGDVDSAGDNSAIEVHRGTTISLHLQDMNRGIFVEVPVLDNEPSVKISGCTFENCGNWPVNLQTDNTDIVFSDNELFNSGTVRVRATPSGNDSIASIVLRNNRFYKHAPFDLTEFDDSTADQPRLLEFSNHYDNVIVEGNHFETDLSDIGAGANRIISLTHCDNISIVNNTFHMKGDNSHIVRGGSAAGESNGTIVCDGNTIIIETTPTTASQLLRVGANNLIQFNNNSLNFGVDSDGIIFVRPQADCKKVICHYNNSLIEDTSLGVHESPVRVSDGVEVNVISIKYNIGDFDRLFRISSTGAVVDRVVASDNHIGSLVSTDGILISDGTLNEYRVYNNKGDGLETESEGEGTIPDTDTSTTITHGLSEPPNLEDIHIVFGTTIDPASYWWVDGISGTEFTVNLDGSPNTTVEFNWKVRRY